MRCGVDGLIPSEKTELEAEFFTTSNFPRNNLGYNPDPGKVHPVVAREMKRRPISTAPSNISPESLVVTMKRVRELLNNDKAYTTMVSKSYIKMGITGNNDLYVALDRTRDSLELAAVFVKQFKETSGDFDLCHKQGPFYRCTVMYMDERRKYDHKYFQ